MKIYSSMSDGKDKIELDKDSTIEFYSGDGKRNCIRVHFNEDGSLNINGDSTICFKAKASNSIDVKL